MAHSTVRKFNNVDLRSYATLALFFDLVGLTLAWSSTIWVRVALNRFFSIQLTADEAIRLAPPLNSLLLLWCLFEFRQWLTSDEAPASPTRMLKMFERALVAGALVIVATFFSREFGNDISRSLVLLFIPMSFVALWTSRHFSCVAVLGIQKYWPRVERVAIIGHGEECRRLGIAMRQARHDVHLAGYIVSGDLEGHAAVPEQRILGTTGELAQLINTESLHRLVMAGDFREEEFSEYLDIANRMGVALSRTVSAPIEGFEPRIADGYGYHLLHMEPVPIARWESAVKRVADVVLSAALLLLLLPLLLAVALAIRLTSPGPVIYRSTRVGKGGRHFTFLKFRSMVVAAEKLQGEFGKNEKSGHIFKMRNDPRVTAIGRIIRRTSIDELPQLVNVLRGEMSLVGPRPLPARDLDPDGMSKVFQSWAEHRARVLPGITGLWQISGRSELSFEEMAQLDIDYVQNWSLVSDFRILATTPVVLLTGKGAY